MHGTTTPSSPELYQSCADGWHAGFEAKRQFLRLLAGGTNQCEDWGHRYGRSTGLCRVAGRDLGADLRD